MLTILVDPINLATIPECSTSQSIHLVVNASGGSLTIANWNRTIADNLLNENFGWRRQFFVGDPLVQPGNLPNKTAKSFAEEYLYVDGRPVTADSQESMGIIFQLKWVNVVGAEIAALCDRREGMRSNAYSTTNDDYSVGDKVHGTVWDGASPDGVGIDSESGSVYASPVSEGNFVAWLVLTNVLGTSSANGTAPEMEYILLKRWDFRVCANNTIPATTVMAIVFGSLLLLGIGAVTVRVCRQTGYRSTLERRDSIQSRRHDSISKIEHFIQANKRDLTKAAQLTAKRKHDFDLVYRETIALYFEAEPNVKERLEVLHEQCKSQAAEAASRIPGGSILLQPDLGFKDAESTTIPLRRQIRYLKTLLAMMRKVGPTAGAKLRTVANDVNREHDLADDATVAHQRSMLFVEGPIKRLDRILDKADLYRNQYEFLRDYARGTFVVSHVSHVSAVLERLLQSTEFEIVRVKNRLMPEYDSVESAGYRDLQLVLRVEEKGQAGLSAASRESKVFPSTEETEEDADLARLKKQGPTFWLYEVQIMTTEIYNLKMGLFASAKRGRATGSKAKAAHEAYMDFRKYKELEVRVREHHSDMVSDLRLERGTKHRGGNAATKSSAAETVPDPTKTIEGEALARLRERQIRSADRRNGWQKVRQKFPAPAPAVDNLECQIADLLSELTNELDEKSNV